MRIQSQSPSAEMKDTNKRPAIICSFFAKGWCIRGGSCRFLHVKDNVNNSGQQAEGDLVYTSRKKESQSEEGISIYKELCNPIFLRIFSAKTFLIKMLSCNRSER